MATTFLTNLTQTLTVTRMTKRDDMMSQNKCLPTSFIHDVKEKKRDSTYWATKFLAMAGAVIQKWAADCGFWILDIGLLYLFLLYESFHTNTLKMVYPTLILYLFNPEKIRQSMRNVFSIELR